MSERYDERELEEVMRSGLAERAEQAPERLTEPFVGRRGRRTRNWLVGGTAAAVAATVIGVSLLSGTTGGPGPGTGDRTSASDPVAGVPDDWRAESYGGVQVWMPPSWETGAAPFEASWEGGAVLDCRDQPDGPYAGRPVMQSDMCTTFDPDRQQTPADDFVWVGSVLEPGTVDLGGGYVEETVVVGGVHVTVTTKDADLRSRILGSVEAVTIDANGCRTGISTPLKPEGPPEIVATSLSVCLYQTDSDGHTVLVWSDRRGAADAAAYTEAAFEQSATYDAGPCERRAPDGEWLEIGANGATETRWDVVNFDCLWGETPDFQYPLNKRTVDPWASPGVKEYVVGPSDYEGMTTVGLDGYFRGIMG